MEEKPSRSEGRSDEKGHWSTSEFGALVARATAHVYRTIIAPEAQGGMKEFLESKCSLFEDLSKEQPLECMSVYEEYERRIERSLDEFAEIEGKSQSEIKQCIERVSSSNKAAAKNLEMLLAAAAYDKFSKIMNRKAKERRKREENEKSCNSRPASEVGMNEDIDLKCTERKEKDYKK